MATSSRLGLEDQLKLRIDKELINQLDDIITKMQNDLAKKFNIQQVKERSPFKNVLTVATDSSSSLEVIKNYIRYQSGRKESSKIWKLEITENGNKTLFSQAVVNQINDLLQNFTNIFNAINNSLNEEIEYLQEESQRSESRDLSNKQENLELLKEYLCSREQQLKQSIHLTLAQLYLGYLSREHTALLGSTQSRM